MQSSCKPRSVDACRSSCEEHVKTAERCPVEEEEALACQRDAEDVLACTMLAAESCTPRFASLADCRSGKVAAKSRDAAVGAAATADDLPAGWVRYDLTELGVSSSLPPGGEPTNKGPSEKLEITEYGVVYVVEGIPNTAQKPTDPSILKTAMAYFGAACNHRLKLYGRYEKEQMIHVRVDATCKDGTLWQGMLHVEPGRSVLTALHYQGKPDVEPPLEPYLYSFHKL
jgi:hypothetical protein